MAAFGFELGGFASVLAEDESTGDKADEEGEEVGHGLRKFSEEGFDLGLKFRDAVGLGLLGDDRLGDVLGNRE